MCMHMTRSRLTEGRDGAGRAGRDGGAARSAAGGGGDDLPVRSDLRQQRAERGLNGPRHGRGPRRLGLRGGHYNYASRSSVVRTFLLKWGHAGPGNGSSTCLRSRRRLGNNVYVADTSNFRIQVFNSSGSICANSRPGSAAGQFESPSGLPSTAAITSTW